MPSNKVDANVLNLHRQAKTARSVSADMAAYRPDDKAWVYLATYPEGRAAYIVRFSFRPETILPDEPGATLKPVLAFKSGVCIFSTSGLQPVENPADFF